MLDHRNATQIRRRQEGLGAELAQGYEPNPAAAADLLYKITVEAGGTLPRGQAVYVGKAQNVQCDRVEGATPTFSDRNQTLTPLLNLGTGSPAAGDIVLASRVDGRLVFRRD